jgi:hypothetical protein
LGLTHSASVNPGKKGRKKKKSVQSSGQLEKYKHSSKAQSSTAQLEKEREEREKLKEETKTSRTHTHTHSSSTRWAAAMLRWIGDNILLLWRLLCFPIEWLCRWVGFCLLSSQVCVCCVDYYL